MLIIPLLMIATVLVSVVTSPLIAMLAYAGGGPDSDRLAIQCVILYNVVLVVGAVWIGWHS